MSKWILILTLTAAAAFAQGGPGANMKAFREDLATAVNNGSLTTEEKQKYEAALKTLDTQRAARESGENVDRRAAMQAMRDLGEVAKSPNLKEEDRAKLEKHVKNTQRMRKGRRGQQ